MKEMRLFIKWKICQYNIMEYPSSIRAGKRNSLITDIINVFIFGAPAKTYKYCSAYNKINDFFIMFNLHENVS